VIQPDTIGAHNSAHSARPARSRVQLVALTLAAIALSAIVLTLAANSGGTLENPVGAGIWEIAMTIIAIGFLGVGITQSVRMGKLSTPLLMTVATATAFWQETYGDWGTYLLYSPEFATYDWGQTRFSSPVQCWWFIAGYVFFYTTFFQAMAKTVPYVRERWPNVNPYLSTALVSFPLFYLFDLALEGSAHGFGWWQYQYSFGPSAAIGTGHFPLLWPILEQVPFMILAAWALTWRSSKEEDLFVTVARLVTRRTPGQVSILISWIACINVLFLTTTIIPLMALRWFAGPASAVVP
jgi:hypothetical protein